jgi:ribokinase
LSIPPEIVIVGSHAPGLFIRVNRIPVAGETVIGWGFEEPADGGKGSNQAIAAARLGGRVSFVGCFGQDRIGDEGERWMREAGVDTRFVRRSPTTGTGVGFILLNAEGVPAMVTAMGANFELKAEEVEAALAQLQGARVLLTQFEIEPAVAVQAARVARRLGMTAIVNPAPAPDEPVAGLDAADILVPNEIEAKVLAGYAPGEAVEPRQLAKELRARTGAACVIVTVGEQGAVGADEAGVWQARPPAVTVADTSGAGDAFCAALAVALARGQQVRAATEWACRVSAFSVSRPGTIPSYPTAEEVDNFTAA